LNVQQIWWQTIRPRTLPAAVGPVLLGQVLVVEGYFSWVTAVLSVLCALALQIAVNLANDLFDGLSGVDQPDRLGPTRALQSGLLSAAQLRAGLALALGTAIASGLWLIIFGHWILWLLGGLAVLAVLGYSGGRRPYANQGLGELAVWFFFGPVAVLGSLLAQRSPIGAEAVVASILVGLPVAAILVVNNLRDRHGDERAGKLHPGGTDGRGQHPLVVRWPASGPRSADPAPEAARLGLVSLDRIAPAGRSPRPPGCHSGRPRAKPTARLDGTVFPALCAVAGTPSRGHVVLSTNRCDGIRHWPLDQVHPSQTMTPAIRPPRGSTQ
jgi:hypothetical protein